MPLWIGEDSENSVYSNRHAKYKQQKEQLDKQRELEDFIALTNKKVNEAGENRHNDFWSKAGHFTNNVLSLGLHGQVDDMQKAQAKKDEISNAAKEADKKEAWKPLSEKLRESYNKDTSFSDIAKKAQEHSKNLSNPGYYGDKVKDFFVSSSDKINDSIKDTMEVNARSDQISKDAQAQSEWNDKLRKAKKTGDEKSIFEAQHMVNFYSKRNNEQIEQNDKQAATLTNERAAGIGLSVALDLANAATMAYGVGTGIAKGAITTAARQKLTAEIGEEGVKAMSKSAMKQFEKEAFKAASGEFGKVAGMGGRKMIGEKASQAAMKSFEAHPYLEGGAEAVVQGVLDPYARAASENRNLADATKEIPGSIATNVGAMTGLTFGGRLLGKEVIGPWASKSSGISDEVMSKVVDSAKFSSIDSKIAYLIADGASKESINKLNKSQITQAFNQVRQGKELAANSPQPKGDTLALPAGDRLGNADNPSYFGKDNFTDQLGTDEAGNTFVSTDRPLESVQRPGEEVAGHTQYGDFGGTSDSYIMNPEAAARDMSPERGIGSEVPEIYDGGKNAQDFVQGHEAAHLDSRQPTDMPKDLYENAMHLKSLRGLADRGIISEEQFVKAKNATELNAPGSSEAYNRLSGGDVLTTTKETIGGFGPQQIDNTLDMEAMSKNSGLPDGDVIDPTNERLMGQTVSENQLADGPTLGGVEPVAPGERIQINPSEVAPIDTKPTLLEGIDPVLQASTRKTEAIEDIMGIDKRMTELETSLRDAGKWDEDATPMMSGNDRNNGFPISQAKDDGFGNKIYDDPMAQEWFDLRNERFSVNSELEGMNALSDMDGNEFLAQNQSQYLTTDQKKILAGETPGDKKNNIAMLDAENDIYRTAPDMLTDEQKMSQIADELDNPKPSTPMGVNKDTGAEEFSHPTFGTATPVSQNHIDITSGKLPDPQKTTQSIIDDLIKQGDDLGADLPEGTYTYKRKASNFSDWLIRKNKTFRSTLANGETVMASMDPKDAKNLYGQQAIKGMRQWDTEQEKFTKEFIDDLNYFSKSDEAADNIDLDTHFIDDKNAPSLIPTNPDSQRYAGVLSRVIGMLNNAGAEIPVKNNYLPNPIIPGKLPDLARFVEVNGDVILDDGKTIREAFGRAVDKMSKDKSGYSDMDPRQIKGFMAFERTEKMGLPPELLDEYRSFFVTDPMEKLLMYVEGAGKQYADLKVWGKGLSKWNEIRSGVVKQNGTEWGTASRDYLDMLREHTIHPANNEALNMLRAFQTLTKMQLAGIANLSQSINTAIMHGVGNTASAMADLKRIPMDELRQMATDRGLNLTTLSDELEGKVNGAMARARLMGTGKTADLVQKAADLQLTLNLFKTIEEKNRIVSMLAAEKKITKLSERMAGGEVLRGADLSYLQNVGIGEVELLAKGGIDGDMASRAIKEGVSKTQFYTNPKDMAAVVHKNWVTKGIFQLGQFSMKQTEFLKDAVLREVPLMLNDKDPRHLIPLMKWVGLAVPVGAGVQWIKGQGIPLAVNTVASPFTDWRMQSKESEMTLARATNNPDDIMGTASKLAAFGAEKMNYSGGFGYFDSIANNWKYSKGPFDFGAKMLGPTGSDIGTMGDITYNVAKGLSDPENTDWGRIGETSAKEAIKRIPFVGPVLKQAIYPYNPGDNVYYDIKNKIGSIGDPSDGDVAEFVKKVQAGQDPSETRVASSYVKKVYDEKTGEQKKIVDKKTRDAVMAFIRDNNIDPYKAMNYGNERSAELRGITELMSDDEKALRTMGINKAQTYMEENGIDWSEVPNLQAWFELNGDTIE